MIILIVTFVFAFCLLLFLGNFGGFVLACLGFSLLVGLYIKAGDILRDLKAIKAVLNVPEVDENVNSGYVSPTEIEKAALVAGEESFLEKEEFSQTEDPSLTPEERERLQKLNDEIELELESLVQDDSIEKKPSDPKKP
ncbi:hypothetical protein [Gorillibacterium sp. CAU 1737]|uniref:hypothetical protein n=1 Tax=Gorillibacterium sp. CAU 1737 TaxID=3140362 RepID=UPI003261221D